MLIDKIINFFSPTNSFIVDQVDSDRGVVVVADQSIDLKIEVKLEDGKKLKSAKIIAPYDVLLEYEDGTSKKVRFLK